MRTKHLRVLLAAMAVWVALLPQSATAHDVVGSRIGELSVEPGFCVHGSVRQWHHQHQIDTWASDCRNIRNRWHTQLQEYYKVVPGQNWGTLCFSEGWHQSPGSVAFHRKFYGWDIWHGCNNGGGVNVVITIDSWQYSWKSDQEGWRGGAWRPATEHCHCP